MTDIGISTAPRLVHIAHAQECEGLLIPGELTVPEDLDAYILTGGYPKLPDDSTLRDTAAQAGLLGAGGAGFPTSVKLQAVASGDGPRIVIANGDEGEPASVKDRWLMQARPHLVLDGLRTTIAAVNADRGIVYVSEETSEIAMQRALAEGGPAQERIPIEVFRVPRGYVAGEETSVVRAIDGDEAKPMPKPPRPYEEGVGGHPTLVLNVETMSRFALAARDGLLEAAMATVLVTVTYGEQAVLLEVPASFTVGDLLALHPDAEAADPQALLVGGFAGGIWGPEMLSAKLTHEDFRNRGALWGCGAIIALSHRDCVIDVTLDVARYFQASSSGQCGACVVGTRVIVEHLSRLARGEQKDDDYEKLNIRAEAMIGRGNCAMPDADSAVIQSLVANFGDILNQHMTSGCDICAAEATEQSGDFTRFRVQLKDLAPKPIN